jgi:hypothetical protein
LQGGFLTSEALEKEGAANGTRKAVGALDAGSDAGGEVDSTEVGGWSGGEGEWGVW